MPPHRYSPIDVEFGRQLKAIREKRGFRFRADFARAVQAKGLERGIKGFKFVPSNVTNYEKGYSAPSRALWSLIAEVLNVKLVVGSETIEIVEI